MDVACVNAFIVYNMVHQKDIILLDYKTVVLTLLIGRYTSRSRAPPEQKDRSKRKYQYHFEPKNMPFHLPEFENNRKRCDYCYKEEFERKTLVKWTECGVFLCLGKEQVFFSKTFFFFSNLFIVVFSSYSIVEVFTEQNKHAELCNYGLQCNVQKQSPGGVLYKRIS